MLWQPFPLPSACPPHPPILPCRASHHTLVRQHMSGVLWDPFHASDRRDRHYRVFTIPLGSVQPLVEGKWGEWEYNIWHKFTSDLCHHTPTAYVSTSYEFVTTSVNLRKHKQNSRCWCHQIVRIYFSKRVLRGRMTYFVNYVQIGSKGQVFLLLLMLENAPDFISNVVSWQTQIFIILMDFSNMHVGQWLKCYSFIYGNRVMNKFE